MVDFYKISQEDIDKAFPLNHEITSEDVIRIFLPNGPDLVFRGQLLCSYYDLYVYKTNKNKYVCLNDDLLKRRVLIASDDKQIVDFFGFEKNAKELYSKLAINKDLYIMDLTK